VHVPEDRWRCGFGDAGEKFVDRFLEEVMCLKVLRVEGVGVKNTCTAEGLAAALSEISEIKREDAKQVSDCQKYVIFNGICRQCR